MTDFQLCFLLKELLSLKTLIYKTTSILSSLISFNPRSTPNSTWSILPVQNEFESPELVAKDWKNVKKSTSPSVNSPTSFPPSLRNAPNTSPTETPNSHVFLKTPSEETLSLPSLPQSPPLTNPFQKLFPLSNSHLGLSISKTQSASTKKISRSNL